MATTLPIAGGTAAAGRAQSSFIARLHLRCKMAPESGSGDRDGSPAPLFMIDAMLGSLARKLRMMGFDAEYARPGRLGPKAFKPMVAEGRILVTRSEDAAARARKAGVTGTVVLRRRPGRTPAPDESDLAELARQLHIPFAVRADRSRCAACNGTLSREGPAVPPEVPPRVAEACTEFWRCSRCSKVYWEGTHLQNLEEMVARLNG